MRNLHRVVWSKGMFLTPQHFQAQDDYFEQNLQFRCTASTSVNWGLTSLAVDQESLTNGLFTIRHCRGVMPDGLTFSMPDSDEPPQGREIADYFPPTQPELDVYLAVPESRPRGKNVTANGARGDAGTRYVAQTRMVLDETSGLEEKAVQFANKNFRLVFGGESLDGTVFLRIAQITRSAAEFAAGDAGNFWLLHTANTFLPQLKHLWNARRRHPEMMYYTMLGLAGALSTFSLDEQARNLPDYDHENLGRCFTELDEKIRLLLETAIPSKCVVVSLRAIEKSIFTGQIAEEQYFKKTQFFLSVGAQMGMDDLIQQTPKLVKISAPSEIHRLVRLSLPGLTLRHTPVPPAAIPVNSDRQYFALNQSGILWDGIVKSSQVAIFVPDEIQKPELELLIVLE